MGSPGFPLPWSMWGLHSASIVQKRMRCQALVLRKNRNLCPSLLFLCLLPSPATLAFELVVQVKRAGIGGILFYWTCQVCVKKVSV